MINNAINIEKLCSQNCNKRLYERKIHIQDFKHDKHNYLNTAIGRRKRYMESIIEWKIILSGTFNLRKF